MKRGISTISAIAFTVTGCVDRGPLPALTHVGVPAPDPKEVQYPNANPLLGFRAAAQNAQSQGTPSSYKDFMRSGFSLVYIRCNEYFDRKGTNQAQANLIRSSIAPIAAVVSGVMALHSYKSTDNAEHDLALLTLGTSAAISALDVYSQNFLFGADNVESVREMANEELSTHASAALALEPRNIEEAAMQIVDHQTICTPSHILKSARAAIAKGKFGAAVAGGGGVDFSADSLDEVGVLLNLVPPTVTDTQAGFLYAITMGMARTQTELKFVRLKLAALPEAANPVRVNQDGTFEVKSDYPFDKLKTLFNKLPAASKQYLSTAATTIMAGVAANGAAGLQSFFLSTTSEFQMPPAQTGELRRVRVEAR